MSRWHRKKGRKGSSMKSLKKEFEEEDDDFLEDLVVNTNQEGSKNMTTYSNLKQCGFITKAEDRKGRLDKRHARIAAARQQDDDDDDDDDIDETKKGKIRKGNQTVAKGVKKN